MANKGLFPSIVACLDAPVRSALYAAESIDAKKGFGSESDREAYWMCASSWYFLCLDSLGATSANNLLWGYQQCGLFKMVELGEEFASLYLQSLNGGAVSIPSTLFAEVFCSADLSGLDEASVCKLLLQVCRFAKRLALNDPTNDGDIDARSIEKFVACAKKCSTLNNHWDLWPGPTIMGYVREEIYDILGGQGAYFKHWSGYAREAGRVGLTSNGNYAKYLARGSFSSGSIRLDSGRTTSDIGVKYSELVCSGIKSLQPDCSLQSLALTDFPDITNSRKSRRFSTYNHVLFKFKRGGGAALALPKRCVKVMCVPKDYHNRRIIAPEPSFMNWFGHSTREYLLHLCTNYGHSINYMDPVDQSTNSRLAKVGSLDGSWDTLDLSSASDSIPRQIFFSVFPMELRQLVSYTLPDWYVLPDGAMHRCSMLATSGNVLTPILQSIFFLGLGRVACRLCGLSEQYVYVYNDDIVIDPRASATLSELITAFGGTVNTKKSYIAGPYRESCGGEYYNGAPVGPIYWPRQPLPKQHALKVKFITTLQQRMFEYPTVRNFLTRVCKSFVPDMTYSPVGADCDDLWASYLSDYDSLRLGHYKLQAYSTQRKREDEADDHFGKLAFTLDQYERFLLNGPVYATELDRLLHVSSPTTLVGDYAQRKMVKWVMEKPLIRLNW